MPQTDLDGNEITSEEIITKKTVHYGARFCLSITETGEEELERMKMDDKDISSWIAKHMRLKEVLPIGEEGQCFQIDVDNFKNKLK